MKNVGAMSVALYPVPGIIVATFHPTIRIGLERHTTMCTGCITLLACTCVTGAAIGASWAIGCSCSGTQMGQGLSGVVTRNPDIEPVRAMERKIKINRERERKRESGI